MRHFVSGGAGFIGSHLVNRLMDDGEQVTVYDNLASGSKQSIEHHMGKDGFLFAEGDLLDFERLKQSLEGHDVVWHLGANTDIRKGNDMTDIDLKNCTIATWNVLDAMRQLKVGKVLFSSSATVYGDIPPFPISETFGPLLPIALYGAGKLACEALLSAYCHLFNLKAWIFRFGNVVGAGMGHGVIYDFIQKVRRNPQEMEILGDGHQEKNYFMVEDCIEGMLFAFRQTEGNPCEVFNLGCASTIKVTDIAHIVVQEMGMTDVRFRYTGGKRGWPGDAPVAILDVDKMKRLGWESKYSSAQAVRMATRRLIGKEE